MAIKLQHETFKSAGQDWQVFTAAPKKAKGVIIVIHEIWGLNDDIRRIAREFAEAGYLAVAPDLYSQEDPVEELSEDIYVKVFNDPFRKRALSALHDLKIWIEDKGWEDGQIAITGFCFGGTYALGYLLEYGDLAGAISFYGQTPDEAAIKKLRKPLLALIGEDDDFLQPHRERMIKFTDELSLPIEVKTYPNAGHSFMNKYRDGTYRDEAATKAWQETLNFLEKNLKPGR